MRLIFKAGKELEEGIKEYCGFFGIKQADGGMTVRAEKSERDLYVESDGRNAVIGYPKTCAFFYGLSFVCAYYKKPVKLKRSFRKPEVGLIRDVSSGAALNQRGLKTLIICLAALGYDYLGLYIEDMIELKNYPYFGNMKGRYTAGQIKETVGYARKFGVDVVPFVQTLSHLSGAFRQDAFYDINDIDDVLLADDENTYRFIDALIKTVSENFDCKRVNIGMDGSPMMFMGKYLDEHGYFSDKSEIFMRHFNRVCEICFQYGLTPETWSDFFERSADCIKR